MQNSFTRPVIVIILSSIASLLVFWFGLRIFGGWYDVWSNQAPSMYSGDCNVAIVPITGEVTSAGDPGDGSSTTTLANDVVDELTQAEASDNVKGVLVQIDSTGGSPVGGEMMMNALKRLTKPSVAVIGDQGDSAAYMAATGAQRIIASHLSEVGSIGITESYVSNAAQNAQNGLTFEQLSSGPYKDMLSPDKPLTDAERALASRDLKVLSDWFIHVVTQNRNLPLDQVQRLADGSTLPGELALKAGLIDELGDQETAQTWLEGKIGGKVAWCR